MGAEARKVTLDDLSAALRLPKFSVSRALGGKAGVSERTRGAVLKVARELGYDHPSLRTVAHSAATQQVLLAIPREDTANNQYWMEVIGSAEAEARRRGFMLVTTMVGTEGFSEDRTAGVAGLLLAGRRSRGVLEPYLKVRVPIVLIGYPRPDEPIDAVHIANREAGYLVGQHLRALGHRRIAFVTDAPEDVPCNERLRGCRDALADLPACTVVKAAFDPDTGTAGLLDCLRALSPPATAVVCGSDAITFTAMLVVREAGLRVPEDISLVGSNDVAGPRQWPREMTTLRPPIQDLGATAMSMLIWRIASGRTPAPRRLSLATQLIVRRSTGVAAAATSS